MELLTRAPQEAVAFRTAVSGWGADPSLRPGGAWMALQPVAWRAGTFPGAGAFHVPGHRAGWSC